MELQSISNRYFTLDEVLRDIPETATDVVTDIEDAYQSYKEELNEELKTTDRVWLEFQAGQCEQFGHAAKSLLYRIVKSSVGSPENSVAAANAITILKVMGVSFSCLDLREIQVPKADLSSAVLDNADLSSSVLDNVILTGASIYNINMKKASLKDVQIGRIARSLKHNLAFDFVQLSSDDKYIVTCNSNFKNEIYIWNVNSETFDKHELQFIYSANRLPTMKLYSLDENFFFVSDVRGVVNIYTLNPFRLEKRLTVVINELHGTIGIPLLTISPCGKYLLTACPRNFTPRLNELVSMKYFFTEISIYKLELSKKGLELYKLKKIEVKRPPILQICFSPKGSFFVSLESEASEESGSKESIKAVIWDALTFTELAYWEGLYSPLPIVPSHEDRTSHAALNIQFTQDEKQIFIVVGRRVYSWNSWGEKDKTWSLQNSERKEAFFEEKAVCSMQLIANTYMLIYISDGIIYLRDMSRNILVSTIKKTSGFKQVLVTADTKYIIGNHNKEICIWNTSDIIQEPLISRGKVLASRFLLEERQIASISRSFQIEMYDILNGANLSSQKLYVPMAVGLRLEIGKECLPILNREYVIAQFFDKKDSKPKLLVLFPILASITVSPFVMDVNCTSYAFCSNYQYFFRIERRMLELYKTMPDEKLLGTIDIPKFFKDECKIGLSKNFLKNRLIALVDKDCAAIYTIKFESTLSLEMQKKIEFLESDVDEILHVRFTCDNKLLVIIRREEITTWNIEKNYLNNFRIKADVFDISRSESLLVSYTNEDENIEKNKTLCLWNLTSRVMLDEVVVSYRITNISLSSNNGYIAACDEHENFYVWQIVQERLRLLWRTEQEFRALKINSNTERS